MTRRDFLRRFRKSRETRPETSLLVVFLAAIVAGALLLWSPLSAGRGAPSLSLADAFFMATSATCVTGLATVDVPSQFSAFGQLVILLLIQLGGVGIMTFAAFFLVVLGRQLTAKSESLISSTIGGEENRSLRSLLKSTIGLAVGFEMVGAAALAAHLHAHGCPWARAVWRGMFHAVSSFCNAGISIEPGGMVPFRGDWAFMAVTILLVVAGSMGFVVMSELSGPRGAGQGRAAARSLSLHTTLVLRMFAILCVTGFVAFIALEWNRSLRGLPVGEKTAIATFQSIAARTSGFSTISVADTTPAVKFITMVQMFVGGAPGSAAGGIKTTTAAILLLTMVSIIHGRASVQVRSRSIPAQVVGQAVAAFMTMTLLALATICVLLVTECHTPGGISGASAVFEAISACSTTGLSLGATPCLSTAGRVALVFAMYLGRIGPLTAAFLVGRAGGRDGALVKFPEEDVIVG